MKTSISEFFEDEPTDFEKNLNAIMDSIIEYLSNNLPTMFKVRIHGMVGHDCFYKLKKSDKSILVRIAYNSKFAHRDSSGNLHREILVSWCVIQFLDYGVILRRDLSIYTLQYAEPDLLDHILKYVRYDAL